ncbi:hypothetical protein LY76DRAFT_381637 [Colletotrichum caudatum]|nr:hypothetical protein LY76DRAFT_381637 [Colletotrichum caudatum]
MCSLPRRCPQTQRLLSRNPNQVFYICPGHQFWLRTLASYPGNPFWTPLLARQLYWRIQRLASSSIQCTPEDISIKQPTKSMSIQEVMAAINAFP